MSTYLYRVKQLSLIFLLLHGFNFAFGQVNLVPNGSFEVMDTCPPLSGCAEGNLSLAIGWYQPIDCTSDFRHTCGYPDGCGIEPGIPSDGEGLAGVSVFSGGNTREYAAIELTEHLHADSSYLFSLKLRLPNSETVRTGSFGAFFSPDSATDYSNFSSLIPVTPQLQRNPDSIMTDPEIWYSWTDTLLAKGGEKFMVLGNFLSDQNTPHIQPSWIPGGGCMIDDVRLTPITIHRPNSIDVMEFHVSVFPNPTENLINIQTEIQLLKVWLTDLAGKRLAVASRTGTKWQIDVGLYPAGIYLIEALAENGTRSIQKVVVQ